MPGRAFSFFFITATASLWSARYLRRRTRSRRRPREGKTTTSAFPFVRISFIFLLFLVSKKHKDQSKLPSVPSFVPAVFMPAVATTPRRRHLAPADSNGPPYFFSMDWPPGFHTAFLARGAENRAVLSTATQKVALGKRQNRHTGTGHSGMCPRSRAGQHSGINP